MLLTILFACSKKNNDNTPPATGSLSGTVQTWDDKLTSTTDVAGITVTITNLTGVSTTTDANGRYTFNNLPFDTYDLSFSKGGYGTYRVFGISHANTGSQTPTQVPLVAYGKQSTTTVTGLSVNGSSLNGEPGVTFAYNLNPAPSTASRAFVRYFLGTTSDVSSNNYRAFSQLSNFSNLSNITGFTQSQLIAMGFSSGQTVFVRMYGDSWRSNDYFDPNLGRQVFPNINPTTVAAISFVVP
ncbi:MAG: hypothetical protein RJA57_1920 [Bacteroidota bacterium]